MGFEVQVSPGVQVREFDLTTIIPAIAATTGALAGVFLWGPIGERILVLNEPDLVRRFGPPTNHNAVTWFTVANFLAYGAPCWVSRAANCTTNNVSIGTLSAFANTAAVTNATFHTIRNRNEYETRDGLFDTDCEWIARYPGSRGNSLRVSECADARSFNSTINLESLGSGAVFSVNIGSNTGTVVITANSITTANAAAINVTAHFGTTDLVTVGNNDIGKQFMKLTAVDYVAGTDSSGNSTTGSATVKFEFEDQMRLHTDYSANDSVERFWEFYSLFSSNPPGQSAWVEQFGNTAANDEIHVVVVDNLGAFSGVPGTVLEHYLGLSRCTEALAIDGGTNYYKDVINHGSQYVWWANDFTTAPSANARNIASATTTEPINLTFAGGQDGASEANVSVGILATAYDLFRSPEDVDVTLIMAGLPRGGINGSQIPNYLIDNIAEVRRDVVVFTSPYKDAVVNNVGFEMEDLIAFRDNLRSTSYGVLDSGWKFMYDRYNDINRWVPLNGDIAGLCARVDADRDPWWSPAGYNRGRIKNLIKLAYNPRKAERDLLYPNGINPVITDGPQGTLLFGDKTMLATPSAFDRINVRRLFITIEKAIAFAAKFDLFEFNDSFTRAQFKAMVNPYLRDIKGRRGITDFLVVCDDSNNTGFVIDRNEFVGDIYVKPARSINFITLNFIAVPTGVSFDEVIGKFGG